MFLWTCLWFAIVALPQVTIPLPFLNKLNFAFYYLSIFFFKLTKSSSFVFQLRFAIILPSAFPFNLLVIISSYVCYIPHKLTGFTFIISPSNMCYNFLAVSFNFIPGKNKKHGLLCKNFKNNKKWLLSYIWVSFSRKKKKSQSTEIFQMNMISTHYKGLWKIRNI